MCSTEYSTKKVLFLFLFLILLFVVEASSLEKEDPELGKKIRGHRLKHYKDWTFRVSKSNNLAPVGGPDGYVDIRWDMTNESESVYSANITISNYLKDWDFELPWELEFIWASKETLLRTLSAEEGTQHGFVSFKNDTYCFNNVTFVDLLPQQSDDDDCKGGVIPPSFPKPGIAKISFQISVSHSNIGEQQSPSHVNLTTRGLEYVRECNSWSQVTNYPNTWRKTCVLSISRSHETHNKEEL